MIADGLRCLVLNAGGTHHPDKPAADAWASRTASGPTRPHLAFIQEVPSKSWLAVWQDLGYRAVLGHARGWAVRSAILTLLPRERLVALTADDVPELRYHGEYVAAARLLHWQPGRGLTLLSVHASPSPTSTEYTQHYPRLDEVGRRSGGRDERHAGARWDADVVLETVRRCGPDVLACGDFNEARGWDDVHTGHTWGAEYFGRPDDNGRLVDGAVQSVALVEAPLSADGTEVVTRRAPGHPPLQLDHVLAGRDVAALVRDARVDEDWTGSSPAVSGLADHGPISFVLGGSASR